MWLCSSSKCLSTLASPHLTKWQHMQMARGAHCPSSPPRPVSALQWHRAADFAQAQPPRLSHPLINSTQRHIRHSLTVSAWVWCWRHKPEPLPCRRWQRWGEEWWQRNAPESSRSKSISAFIPLGGLRQLRPLFALPRAPWLALGREKGDVC